MIIQVDEEGKTAVTQLCDIALKQGGIQIMQGVATILTAVKQLPFNEPDEDTADENTADND